MLRAIVQRLREPWLRRIGVLRLRLREGGPELAQFVAREHAASTHPQSAANASCSGCLDVAREASEVGRALKFLPLALAVAIGVAAYDSALDSKFGHFPLGSFRAKHTDMDGVEKRIVYILRSDSQPSRHYVGITNDFHDRLGWHNDGKCGHTVRLRPWSVVVSLEFPSEEAAVRFEKYLKSGSGRAFTKRRFAAADNRPSISHLK